MSGFYTDGRIHMYNMYDIYNRNADYIYRQYNYSISTSA